ncbi:bifunctional methylenetetrahydrofolate dehydrogenase/methenyltetrahydrofolate cyclohydrolase [bacterium]|mgnify:FL=1|jgi:methylenetetrahydrofolate dehydrogenase (NADP+) / methenyltetrahydrofolate cyclohydrolase|nr:bifunctional methylenetetrahydrofolate dehydrogenase/methenyltetrahydrofolate cyclohydrolase [bacterium]MBT6831651.1 bifunctional methylenetetrahydrofolate dehydrogenase/methenyltetrahydrofolate cyclohydrolase [bacterium]MBT6996297.1 bifunctional methylenetetrahydrofolate dehydrogenase/methenyltetrahydrofolate cyclohydrolase [bacterium]MBT7772975.1 bifunctional methylenetetrahydrofolate dehydrogenase/methenyltetrahydrofolate cyclohydrolase [bacterium]
MAKIISGKQIAEKIIETELVPRVEILKKSGIVPKLVVVLVGEHPASASYVKQKEKFAEKAGIHSEIRRFSDEISEAEILGEIAKINADPKIHGVIVQLPVPEKISVPKILRAIDPRKDVDGFTPENIGKLFLGEPCLECCTPKGIIRMIEESGEVLEGKKVVVVGRSNIVGKPVAALALNRNATVTICHSRTKNLNDEIKTADILIVAVGRPNFVHGDQIKSGCVVIDVGIHRTDDGKLCGDVDFESAEKVAAKISPVPGGVGPMTVVSLIGNTVEAAEN